MTQPIVGVMLKMWEMLSGSRSLSCHPASAGEREREGRREERTGTFFWVMTTDESTPRMAMVVCPAPEMALKAYSAPRTNVSSSRSTQLFTTRTDLVQTSFGAAFRGLSAGSQQGREGYNAREHGQVAIVRGARHGG